MSIWFEEIKDALSRAQAAILSISASFLGSEFVKNKEIPPMLDRLYRKDDSFCVFPILIPPCVWRTVEWLRKLQIRPEDGEALSVGDENTIDAQLARITLEIAELLGKE